VVDVDRQALVERMRSYLGARRFSDAARASPEMAKPRARYLPEAVWRRASGSFDAGSVSWLTAAGRSWRGPVSFGVTRFGSAKKRRARTRVPFPRGAGRTALDCADQFGEASRYVSNLRRSYQVGA
jgi:hypothetical protein